MKDSPKPLNELSLMVAFSCMSQMVQPCPQPHPTYSEKDSVVAEVWGPQTLVLVPNCSFLDGVEQDPSSVSAPRSPFPTAPVQYLSLMHTLPRRLRSTVRDPRSHQLAKTAVLRLHRPENEGTGEGDAIFGRAIRTPLCWMRGLELRFPLRVQVVSSHIHGLGTAPVPGRLAMQIGENTKYNHNMQCVGSINTYSTISECT